TGDEGSDAESLSYPTAVWVDDEAQVVYVADSSNNRIQRWLPNALIDDTVAGGAASVTGDFWILVHGPALVGLTSITPPTGKLVKI
ncbi:unnamed protein product, partial [Rotaria sp. Silwood1]